jgi:hypothetical protein
MNELVLGVAIGLFTGTVAGTIYSYWNMKKIVDYTILKYKCKEQRRRIEALKEFLDEEEGAE